MIIKCEICGKEFKTYNSRIRIGKGKYCSKSCQFKAQEGKPSPKKGIKLTQEQKSKLNLKGLELGRGWNKGLRLGPNPEHSKKMKGKVPWNKGLKGFRKGHLPTFIGKDEKNPAWKGNDVGYGALHDWVRSHLKKPKVCEFCGKINNLHYANKDHEYKRNLDDWLILCAKCHKNYDKKFK